MEKTPQSSGSTIRVLERAIDLIEVLMAAKAPASLVGLSEQVDLHPSTVHRILSTLGKRSYVYQDPETRMYTLGPRLILPVSGEGTLSSLRNLALNPLAALGEKSGEAASMAVRSGNKAIYVCQAAGSGVVKMFVQIGAFVPLHCTGVGKAILAFLDQKEVARIIDDEGLVRMTENTIDSVEDLVKELAQIRQVGYAVDNEERENGIRCVAAPVFGWDGKVAGAISVSGPSGRVSPHLDSVFSDQVRETAAQLSARLGFAESRPEKVD